MGFAWHAFDLTQWCCIGEAIKFGIMSFNRIFWLLAVFICWSPRVANLEYVPSAQ